MFKSSYIAQILFNAKFAEMCLLESAANDLTANELRCALLKPAKTMQKVIPHRSEYELIILIKER